jgi:hypothetical protein
MLQKGNIMLKKCYFLITLIAMLNLIGCDNHYTLEPILEPITQNIEDTSKLSLENYPYLSASVLPTITENDELYAILSREAFGRRYKFGKLHKYDDFSGSRDKGEEHAIETAAHEFLQEGILAGTLGWDLDQTKEYIDPENENTCAIIAYSAVENSDIPHMKKTGNVTYLTHFDKHSHDLFDKFSDARKKEIERYKREGIRKSHWTNAEKDRLAKVKWDDLRKAILDQEDQNEIVEVEAFVMNRRKNFEKQTIQLRPFFVIKLRPFFQGDSYEPGENDKVRFYQN